MNRSGTQVRLPSVEYDESVLYWPRREAFKSLERIRSGNESECVIFPIGTFADRKQWRIRNLVGIDRRLQSMLDSIGIKHALPIQRYCWPKIQDSHFSTICISPEGTGKTYAHLLYAVSKCISATPITKTDELIARENGYYFETDPAADPEDLIAHPKYVIICSSHYQAENVARYIDKMKESAYGPVATEARRRVLPPIVRSVNVHHDEEKLVLRCSESDILIGTPSALLNCFKTGYLHFGKCKKVFFDDLDLALQLHNYNIREIIKIYIIQAQQVDDDLEPMTDRTSPNRFPCQFHLFARKWTDLVKQFVSTVFPQRILIFGSITEASIYANLRFELELYSDEASRITKLLHLISSHVNESERRDKIAIVCRDDEEAEKVGQQLRESGHPVKLFVEECSTKQPKSNLNKRSSREPIYVISDEAIEVEVEFSVSKLPLNNMTQIIHFSMPDEMLTFDQRFRLMCKNIQNVEKSLISTIFIGPKFKNRHAKQLFDLFCRSSTTLTSTKLMLRDSITNKSDAICWRWATTGLCRLEKLAHEDRFGTYCFDRHSLNSDVVNRWPKNGQVKVTITHIVSPNEFYFWFEAHRDINNKKWTKIASTGSEYMKTLQEELDKCKDLFTRSVPLGRIRKGRVYGVYFQQEARVDRVLLLDEPKQEENYTSNNRGGTHKSLINKELEYSKQVPVVKIDYGSRLEVFVKNIIELPQSLSAIEPQCHRGFYLGVKPTDGEPNWLYKAKKAFYDSVRVNNLHEITVWLRLNSDKCFWFERMVVSRRLLNISSGDIFTSEPHRELHLAGLAEATSMEPAGLQPSVRSETLSKWHSDTLGNYAQYAFLRRDRDHSNIFLLDVRRNFEVIIRQSDYNKQLINLESVLKEEYYNGKLVPQRYFAENVYCIVKINEGFEQEKKEPIVTFNRAKILKIIESQEDLESPECRKETKYLVECLDHGDEFAVNDKDIYQASAKHLKQLPFQAIRCKFANLNPNLLNDDALNYRTRTLMFDYTREENNDMKTLKGRLDENDDLYIYVPSDDKTSYVPLASLLDKFSNIRLYDMNDAEFERPIFVRGSEVEANSASMASRRGRILDIMFWILEDMIRDELKAVGVEVESEEEDDICNALKGLDVELD